MRKNLGKYFKMLLVLVLATICTSSTSGTRPTKVLAEWPQIIGASAYNELSLYKFVPLERAVYRAFTNVRTELNLSVDTSDYDMYRAANVSAVLVEHAEANRFLGVFRRMNLWRSRTLPPFEETFVGIDTKLPYRISLHVTQVDYARVLATSVGVLVFVFARQLARNTAVYYTAGCSTGAIASLAILAFLLYRVVPKKSFAVSVLISGWSFSAYLLYAIYGNLHHLLVEYQTYIAAYILCVTTISFAVCYRIGPPSNERSLHLTQWTLQLIALSIIYAVVQMEEVSLCTIGALVLWCCIPQGMGNACRRAWHRFFPPARRLQTEWEYVRTGEVETKKALAELRDYCASPECDQWKTMNKLKSPRRFASFVADGLHLTEAEMLGHGNELSFDDDDRHSISFDDDSEVEPSPQWPPRRGAFSQTPNLWPDSSYAHSRSAIAPRYFSSVRHDQLRRRALVGDEGSRDGTPASNLSMDDANARVRSRRHRARAPRYDNGEMRTPGHRVLVDVSDDEF